MLARLVGAIARAFLVIILIATPSLILPFVSVDTTQVVALVALFAAALTLFEYGSVYPCLIEFRDAPPFNRVRYISLLLTIILLAVVIKGKTEPTTLTQFIEILGRKIAYSIDFPYSPVRLVSMMMSDTATTAETELLRTLAGISYIVSLITLAVFVLLMRVLGWPSRDGVFNVWVNLPTFDPATGGDVIKRMRRDAGLNITLGFMLPFLIPPFVHAASFVFEPMTAASSQTLIWTMTAWAFLPASLFMRGIAIMRVADMISRRRQQNTLTDEAEYQPV